MNVLFLSAGRRVELIQCFIKARNKVDSYGKILAADANNLAPALFFADKHFILPLVKDNNYISALLKLCIDEKIDVVIPTIDTELQILSANKKLLLDHGIKVLVSDESVINICRDKNRTVRFLKENGFLTPQTYRTVEESSQKYPLFIKPLDGSSSINAFKVKNKKELEFFADYVPNPIIQEYIAGDEYTIDVFCDFNSQPVYITTRERIAVRSGEVLKTHIVYDSNLTMKIVHLIKCLKPIGPITIQAIKSHVDQEYYFIEINARYGGGAPLSIMAGADSPTALYCLINGEAVTPDYNAADTDLHFLRFDQSIAIVKKEKSYDRV